MAGKRGNLDGSVYRDGDAWRGAVTLPDGTRKKFRARTRAEATTKMRDALARVDRGEQQLDAKSPDLAAWLAYWLQTKEATVRPKTWQGYDSTIRSLIVPTLGRYKLTALRCDHIEAWHRGLVARGLSSSTVRSGHVVVSMALTLAQRHGRLSQNVASLVSPPRQARPEVQALTKDEARALLTAAIGDRLSARWVVALSLGLRQGEALGLAWSSVDLEVGTLRVSQALQRLTWRHGCPDKSRCRTRASECPQRHGGGLVIKEPKSAAGKRTLTLPAPLVGALRSHRAGQSAERLQAGTYWQQHGLVFTQPNGKPIDPRADTYAWKALLTRAGVRDARLHDARHTAASLLLLQGVPLKVVQVVLGHSQISLTADTYSHVMPELHRDAADRMAAALWE